MSKSRILIVDDDESVQRTRALILTAAGYEVSLARNGFDALLQLKTPDIPTSLSPT